MSLLVHTHLNVYGWTAEQHYVVRYMKDPATNKAWLVDMQGNKVHLKQQPVELGKLTVVPIDKVLMSGMWAGRWNQLYGGGVGKGA